MKLGKILLFWLVLITLYGNATELTRNGWNLIGLCQDINRSDIDMTGIEEIQSQTGESIYTGEWVDFSNLDRLYAGYGYWVKGVSGTTFDSGEADSRLAVELNRDGWNLMAACEDIAKDDINMTELEEIQSQGGESIYTGKWSGLLQS